MIDTQLILAIVFVTALTIFLIVERKKIELQRLLFPVFYIVMLRTKLGLKLMKYIGTKFRTPLKWAGYAGVVVGFLGMIMIAVTLVISTIDLFMRPEAMAGVGLVLPIQAEGVFYVPFVYWILSIFVIAFIHEMSHGILAIVHNIKLKSSGFAFIGVLLPIIPAAFVEPDEVQMSKRPKKQQLSVFAAGPFSNIVTGLVFLALLLFVFYPMIPNVYSNEGITITSVVDEGPVALAGVEAGEIVTAFNGVVIKDLTAFQEAIETVEPGSEVSLTTNKGEYTVLTENLDGDTRLGIFIEQNLVVRPDFAGGKTGAAVFSWIIGLLYWLYLLSLGIGLFNLVPLGPIDGGRMFKMVTDFLPERVGNKIWGVVSIFFLGLILLNIGAGFF